MAKAFLERDYEAVKARKSSQQQPVEDVAMGKAEEKAEPEPSAPEPEPIPVPDTAREEPKPGAEMAEQKAISDAAAPAATVPAAEEKPTEPAQIDLSGTGDQDFVGTTGPAMTGSEPEINFDSVLNDSAGGEGGGGRGGANDFDLNLDFGDDEAGNQNFLSGTNLGGSGIGSGVGDENTPAEVAANQLNTATTSIGGDAFDLELQKTSDAAAGTGAGGEGMNNADDMMGPGQSSFDDLFMENDDSMGDTNFLEGDGLMNLNELEDSWFN